MDLTSAFAVFPELQTERLRLRAVREDDADAIFATMADPEVMRYFGSSPMRTRDEALRRVRLLQEDFATGVGVRWMIEEAASGRLLGSCGFWRLEKPHFRAEIGYELAREAWGRGVMTEAVGAALDFGFGPMGLHSVEAHIHPDNAGSRRVLEKLGFVQEAYFRQNYYDPVEGRFTDTAVFSLLETDWRGRPARSARP